MASNTLSAREQEILSTAIQHCLQNPDGLKIDYKALANYCSFSSEGSVRASWNLLRRKMTSSGSKSVRSGGGASKEKATLVGENGVGKKKWGGGGKKGGKKMKVECEELGNGDDWEEGETTVKEGGEGEERGVAGGEGVGEVDGDEVGV